MLDNLAGLIPGLLQAKKAADNAPKSVNNAVLGGLWLECGLNPHLVAKIRPIIESPAADGQGHQIFTPDTSEPAVAVLFEDAEFSIESQYSTPFEASNPEGRLPNLMGMIQSGQMASAITTVSTAAFPVVDAIAEGVAKVGDVTGATDAMKAGVGEAQNILEGLKGRSNFTKLNSRQIYTSSSSVRISGTVQLSAWSDAKSEVEAVLSKLQQWASAKSLSAQSLLVGAVENGITEGLFPSIIPPVVSLTYGGATYSPLVIESISAPITGPMNKQGNRLSVKAQITFVSLMAWDKNDIQKLRG